MPVPSALAVASLAANRTASASALPRHSKTSSSVKDAFQEALPVPVQRGLDARNFDNINSGFENHSVCSNELSCYTLRPGDRDGQPFRIQMLADRCQHLLGCDRSHHVGIAPEVIQAKVIPFDV